MRPLDRQPGFALVLVLWVLSLLTIMAGSFALGMRREISVIANIKNAARAAALAESGLALAESVLMLEDKEKRWLTDGSIYEIDTEDGFSGTGASGGQIRIRLLSEAGKININLADEKMLENVLKQSPLADDDKARAHLIAALLDWRDQDDEVHLDGAESKEYRAANLRYQPTNKPFQSLDELRLVLGMDDATFKWLLPIVTVYSTQPQVNVQVATREVLLALPDADPELIEEYLKKRRESVLKHLPPPPSPFGNAKGGAAAADDNGALTLISETEMDDGSSAVVGAVIQRGGGDNNTPYQILHWQTYPYPGGSLFADDKEDWVIKKYAESELNG